MVKSLREIVSKKLEGVKSSEIRDGSTGDIPGVDYKSKSPDEAKFVAKHKTEVHADRVGNDGAVYSGDKIKYSLNDPKNKRLGRNEKESIAANESVQCNHSKKGVKCPIHGDTDCSLKEEVIYEQKNIPLKGHDYHYKSNNELKYIMKDAGEAAQAMRNHNSQAESKYLDQMNDAATILHYRKHGGSQFFRKSVDESIINERHMTSSEKSKEKRIKDKTDNSGMKQSMEKEYGNEKGKKVYFATIRKRAMSEDLAEPMLEDSKKKKSAKEEKESAPADTQMNITSGNYPSGNVGDTGRV